MEFRLVYQGKLPAASNSSTRRKEKHDIRRVLHAQLKSLWSTHRYLREYLKPTPQGFPSPADRHADKYDRCGYRFLPLIGEGFGGSADTVCSIDILFLRRDEPGGLVQDGGGDIDNRIKTLFDAFRMPQDCDELRGFSVQPDENPFYCLMKDDSLIAEVKVTTDRLLTPLLDGEHVNDVQLVVRVKTIMLAAY